MQHIFKNLDELTEINDELAQSYSALRTQLKGRDIIVSAETLRNVASASNSELVLLMFDEQEKLVGTAQASRLFVPSHEVGYINAVVVDESLRGKGLGSILMEELQKRAKERWTNLKAFNLTSNPLKGTQGFYTRLGYRMRTKEAQDETIFYVKDLDGYTQ